LKIEIKMDKTYAKMFQRYLPMELQPPPIKLASTPVKYEEKRGNFIEDSKKRENPYKKAIKVKPPGYSDIDPISEVTLK
jgi:hypothetical protein